jgi:hypothetical protein
MWRWDRRRRCRCGERVPQSLLARGNPWLVLAACGLLLIGVRLARQAPSQWREHACLRVPQDSPCRNRGLAALARDPATGTVLNAVTMVLTVVLVMSAVGANSDGNGRQSGPWAAPDRGAGYMVDVGPRDAVILFSPAPIRR